MAVTWSIVQIEYNDDSNKGVTSIHWKAEDSETVDSVKHTGTITGVQEFTPNPSDENYIAYEDITQAKARSWVKSSLGSAQVTAIQDKIALKINEGKNPPKASGLPWITT